jgi:hypothetical protein
VLVRTYRAEAGALGSRRSLLRTCAQSGELVTQGANP